MICTNYKSYFPPIDVPSVISYYFFLQCLSHERFYSPLGFGWSPFVISSMPGCWLSIMRVGTGPFQKCEQNKRQVSAVDILNLRKVLYGKDIWRNYHIESLAKIKFNQLKIKQNGGCLLFFDQHLSVLYN